MQEHSGKIPGKDQQATDRFCWCVKVKKSMSPTRSFSLKCIPSFPKGKLPIVVPSGGLYSLQLPRSKLYSKRSISQLLFKKLLQPRCLSIVFYKMVLLQVTVDRFLDSSFWHLWRGLAVITFL